MNLLDLIIVALGLSAGLGGYRLGLLARAFSWIGLALGFYVAASFVPSAVRSLSGSSPTTRLVVAAVVLVGGALLGQALGMFVGSRVRAIIPWGPLRYLDRSAGAVVGVIGVLVAVWLLIPSMAEVPGSLAREARGSVIGRWVTQAAPSSPNTLQALRRLVGANNFPQVFDVLRPSPVVGPPPAATGLSQALATQLAASTVKVQGVACDRIQEGSGFAVAPNLVVTNAHVVAGEAKTLVDELNGRQLPAVVVAFDSNRDLALLHVAGLGENPLPLTTGHVGQQGAVLGHPNGQDQLDEAPALIR
ncbi:MAG: CvpA family protein, partial [Acidimicrobiales bacterium]